MCIKSCFLFGHADAPQAIFPYLESAIEGAVLNGTTSFYVGYHGNFDHIAAAALRAVKRRHSSILLMLVLAYHPAEVKKETPPDFDGTFYPPLEGVPRRFSLVRGNQYMIKTADSAICYVRRSGNTEKILAIAKRRNIPINNIADLIQPSRSL
ncbi:MAG: hypothetical protein ACI4P4_08950 [Faecousia sp.]